MRVCLIAPNDGMSDPRALVSKRLLEMAGHDVVFVTAGETLGPGTVVSVSSRPGGAPGRLISRIEGKRGRRRRLTAALTEEAVKSDADVYIPTDPRALEAASSAARITGSNVLRTPKMPHAGETDLIDIAPTQPERSMPIDGLGMFHTPDDQRRPYTPAPDRHSGRRIVLGYRKSEINPGRYLEAALIRAGVALQVETESIDLASVDPATDLVLFVEGPYPALDVSGSTDVPTLFWAHHGEHHLHANLRLADRYRADAILLAHSWHLALWFPTPVHRFPFGVATGLLKPEKALTDRLYDVAMVGAGLRSGRQYGRRQQLVAALEQAFPEERLGFGEHVSAEEMASLYGDSRIVINEGGTRHFPITMRVMETVGSRAVLLSDPLPGLEVLFEPDPDFAELGPDVVRDVRHLLGDVDALQAMADAAYERAMGLHTYDHRVDELFDIASQTTKRHIPPVPERSELASVIDADVEVQRVAHLGAPGLADELPTREVWDSETLEPHRLAPGKMESIATRSHDIGGLDDLLAAARRYAYIEGEAHGLSSWLERAAPQAETKRIGGVTRIDFLAPSYRIMTFEKTDV